MYMNNRNHKLSIALKLLTGVLRIDILLHFFKLLTMVSFPFKYILRHVFCNRMINIYAGICSLWLIKSNAHKLAILYKIFDCRYRSLWNLKRQISKSTTSQQWKTLAKKYEEKNKEYFGSSRGLNINDIYDKELLKNKLKQLQKNKENTNINDFMNVLRLDLTRNIGNIAKNKLHEHFMCIPDTILNYIEEVKSQLTHIECSTDISIKDKITFFRETRNSYGRTALLLSGGASFGTFHLGVVKALFEHGLLPRIISGSSVGSIVAAIISVRTDEELVKTYTHIDEMDLEFFSEHKTIKLVQNFLERGHAHDDKHLVQKLRASLGDFTFKEAYDRTGRILNISVCPADTNEAPRLLNYLTAPSVLIWSAVAASSAFPGLFPSQKLYTKTDVGDLRSISKHDIIDSYGRNWKDGSLELDLPVTSLSELFNCNYFIVSQCNPVVIPLLNLKRYANNSLSNILEFELRCRSLQLQQVLPKWVPQQLLKMYSQVWEGDVTVVLPLTFFNPYRIITNPSLQDILSLVKMGEKKMWEHLWAVECNCSIEIYLDTIVKRLCGGKASWGVRSMNDLRLYEKSKNEIILPDCCITTLDVLPSILDLATYNRDSLDVIAP
jgi:TAG lipase / steryl ester hydrolase / phospholipase A2 / LPA acyltransferase